MTFRTRRCAAGALATALVTGCTTRPHEAASSPPSPAPQVRTATGVDAARGCIQNGFHYRPSTLEATAPGPHCFSTPDSSTIPPLAPLDPSETPADLAAVEARSPLDPTRRLARGTFATTPVAGLAPAANSAQIAAFVATTLPTLFLTPDFTAWLRTSANVGGGIGGEDNIPVYTVDSSNPAQHHVTFTSSDPRVTSYPKLVEMTGGSIPVPTWFRPSDGGDHAMAVHDVATGIWRSYFHVVANAAGGYDYASAGYWYGDVGDGTAGDRNYWLSLVQGSSSVVGLSNELTQIGAQEVRAGRIDHAVSVTFPDYLAGRASFPAKQSDGGLDPVRYPNAPMAGQRFTFPTDFDVDAYVRSHGIDPTTAAIMRAVKTYGGIITDHNHWCMAFNFESPYGIADGASKGANVYRTDPVLAARIGAMDVNAFPWALTTWIAPDAAGR